MEDVGISVCRYLYGSNYYDACCRTVISRGIKSPCTDIEYVIHITECTTQCYPTGWAVCYDKVCPYLHLHSITMPAPLHNLAKRLLEILLVVKTTMGLVPYLRMT
jgi:hypothetical protein